MGTELLEMQYKARAITHTAWSKGQDIMATIYNT
jgi:hypothetical protein